MSLVAAVVVVVFAVVVFVFMTNNVRQFSFFLFRCLFSFLFVFVFTLCVGAQRKHSSRNDSKRRSTLTRPAKGALPARLSARCVRARESVGVRARERDCVRVCCSNRVFHAVLSSSSSCSAHEKTSCWCCWTVPPSLSYEFRLRQLRR